MAVGYAQLAETVLPYTVGNGQPAYRTNPATGQRYTFAELTTMAHETSKIHHVSFDSSYVQKENHVFDMQG